MSEEPVFSKIDLFFDFGTLSIQAPCWVEPADYEPISVGILDNPKFSRLNTPAFLVRTEISDYSSPFWQILLAFSRGGTGYKVPFLLSGHRRDMTFEGTVYTPHSLEPPVLEEIVLDSHGVICKYVPQVVDFKILGEFTLRTPNMTETVSY